MNRIFEAINKETSEIIIFGASDQRRAEDFISTNNLGIFEVNQIEEVDGILTNNKPRVIRRYKPKISL